MNPRVRGLIVFLVILVVAVVFCGIFPFVILPGAGTGVALPVITVPGEVVVEGGLFGVDLTNTLIGAFVTDIIILMMVIHLWRVSKGWTKMVPGRAQALFEAFIEAFYNFVYNIGGERLRTAPLLWPLVATIFLFILVGNYSKLMPGVESVGKFHCGHIGFSGYAGIQGWTDNSYRLWIDGVFDAGTEQTEETEHACYAFFNYHLWDRFTEEPTHEGLEVAVSDAEAEMRQAEVHLNEVRASLPADEREFTEEDTAALEEAVKELEHKETVVHAMEDRLHAFEEREEVEPEIASLEEEIAELEATGEEELLVAEEHVAELRAQIIEAEREGASTEELEAELATAEEELHILETKDEQLAELNAELDGLVEQYNNANTRLQYPLATLTFTPEQLETGAMPYVFHVTPFVRGVATDMSFTFGLAILSIIVVQIYGVQSLGMAYFDKFINIPALGNLGKKPLGAVDFIVGLFEIISEIGKIVSLAFRLFGNIFAGGVALIAVTFLVALLVPGVIYGLELIIGAVQALVFAVLTLVFSVQAMEGHHGDDDHEHGHEH